MERQGQDDHRVFTRGVFSGALQEGYRASVCAPSEEGHRADACAPSAGGNSVPYRGGPANPPLVVRGNGAPFCPCGHCCCNRSRTNDSSVQVLVAVIAMMALLAVAFLATVLFIFALFFMKGTGQPSVKESSGSAFQKAYEEPEAPMSPENPNQGGIPDADTDKEGKTLPALPDAKKKTPPAGEVENEKYYGMLEDQVRTDLPYSIEWKNHDYTADGGYAFIWVDYPQIQGDIPNREAINELIAREITYFEEYYEEYSKYMLEGEIFAVYSVGYVTYMDEKTVSVVFEEEVNTDYWLDRGLYCINIDVENGVVVENSSILDIDDEFAVDFRIRSREQNGNDSVLDYMTDQEITYYLTAADSAIIFYTPLGLEVGMNYGENYVTVTYDDYEKYVKKY